MFLSHTEGESLPMEENFSTMTAVSAAGVSSPLRFLPQQSTAPLSLRPQVRASPTLMAVKTPWGGGASPYALFPQQATVPSVRMAHA